MSIVCHIKSIEQHHRIQRWRRQVAELDKALATGSYQPIILPVDTRVDWVAPDSVMTTVTFNSGRLIHDEA